MDQEISDKENLTIGEVLKNYRESQGYTIAEIVRFTKIRYSYIKAIESNEFSSLPERTYTLGYIEKYCRFLGIDSKPILKLVEEKYELKDPIYNNMVQNNRLDKKYNPINLIKENIIDFIFIMFSFGLKRYKPEADLYFDKNCPPKEKVPFVFLIIVLLVIIVIGSIYFIKETNKINIEEDPIAISEELSKELDFVKINKAPDNNTKVNNILNQHDMVLAKNISNNEISNYESNGSIAQIKKSIIDTSEEKSNKTKLTSWPRTNKPSTIILLFNARVWVKIYNKYNKNEVYFDGYFNEGDYFKVPNVSSLRMDVGNYKGLYLLVNDEAIYLNSTSNSLVLRKIDLVDNILLSKYRNRGS